MKKKKKLEKINYIENVAIGLTIGLIFSYSFNINVINGIAIGISLGILLQKIIQEKKITLAIYILVGLLCGCFVSIFFELSKTYAVFALSMGMLIGTIANLFVSKTNKNAEIKDDNQRLVIFIILGILFGGIIGFICYRLNGIIFGIGLGMILGILYYLKKSKKKRK